MAVGVEVGNKISYGRREAEVVHDADQRGVVDSVKCIGEVDLEHVYIFAVVAGIFQG